MPAGDPWFPTPPAFKSLPKGKVYWHVYPCVTEDGVAIDPRSSNPASMARLALPGSHGMFYFSPELTGVLWETILRWIEPDKDGHVEIPLDRLKDMRAVKLRLVSEQATSFPLTQPHLKKYGFGPDTEGWNEIINMLHAPDHPLTHETSTEIHKELNAHGGMEMPVLSWSSRQHSESMVYLAYEPPMRNQWWQMIGHPIHLDDPAEGHALIMSTLEDCGYSWTTDGLYDPATSPPGPGDVD